MKRQIVIVFFIFTSCSEKNEEQTLLYNQLISYRDELKMSVKAQEDYLAETTRHNAFCRERFDSLNKINTELDKSFERLRYGQRKDLLNLRDDYNRNQKLHIKFDTANYYNNIPDSIFNKLIETDILKLRKCFQDRFMFVHGCNIVE